MRKLKFHSNIKNPFAYFYGITDNKFLKLYHGHLNEKFDLNDSEIVVGQGIHRLHRDFSHGF
jgi:hypothetical protein